MAERLCENRLCSKILLQDLDRDMSQASSFKPPFFTLYLLFGGLFAWLYASDPNWKTTAEVLGSCVAIAWALSLINIWPLSNGLGRLLGLRPRTLWGLLGIACSPFLHRDLAHLMANTVPFLVLGWLVLLQREIQGNSDFFGGDAHDSADWWARNLATRTRCHSFRRKRTGIWLHWLFAGRGVCGAYGADVGVGDNCVLDVRLTVVGHVASNE